MNLCLHSNLYWATNSVCFLCTSVKYSWWSWKQYLHSINNLKFKPVRWVQPTFSLCSVCILQPGLLQFHQYLTHSLRWDQLLSVDHENYRFKLFVQNWINSSQTFNLDVPLEELMAIISTINRSGNARHNAILNADHQRILFMVWFCTNHLFMEAKKRR